MKLDIVYYIYWDLWRFFSALFTGKKLRASKEESKRRMDICMSCPLLNKEARFFNYTQPRCTVCGCYMNYKSKLSSMHCDDNPPKW